jgi:hypothetical protein
MTFIDSPLCSSTAKRSSSLIDKTRLQSQYNNNNDQEQLFPPPPPSFLYDNPISNTDQQPIIRASGPGLSDGFVDDNCSYIFLFSNKYF